MVYSSSLEYYKLAAKGCDFATKFNEYSRAFLAQRCSNKSERYAVIAEYGEGRRKGMVMVSGGKLGAGWRTVVRMCEEMIAFIGDSRRKLDASGSSKIRNSVFFATVVQSCTTEKAKVGEVLYAVHVGDDGKGKQQAFQIPNETHADLEACNATTQNISLIELTKVVLSAGANGVICE